MRATAILAGLLLSGPLPAGTVTFGSGFTFIGADQTARLLTRIDTEEWTAEELEHLRLQLADNVREEKGDDRWHRLEALGQLEAALRGPVRSLFTFMEPGGYCWVSCAVWDASTDPPSVVAMAPELALILRLGFDGGVQLIARLDPRTGTWVAAGHAPVDWNEQVAFLHEDGPRALAVDAAGVVTFTTRLNRIYEIARNGKLRKLGEWPQNLGQGGQGWLGPVRLDTSTLAVGPDGSRFLADTRGNTVNILEPQSDGSVRVVPIAGTGEASKGALEAEDARLVDLTPEGLACTPDGSLHFVNGPDHRVCRLTRNDQAWSLTFPPGKGEGAPGTFFSGWPELRALWSPKLVASPDGRIQVMASHDRLSHRRPDLDPDDGLLPGFQKPSLSHYVEWLAPVPGGVLVLDHVSRIVLVPFLEPAEPIPQRVAEARKAWAAGDLKTFEAIRAQLEAWRDAKPPSREPRFGTRLADQSPLGVTGLMDELLLIVEDYLWDPSLPWRARLALRDLEAEEEVSGP